MCRANCEYARVLFAFPRQAVSSSPFSLYLITLPMKGAVPEQAAIQPLDNETEDWVVCLETHWCYACGQESLFWVQSFTERMSKGPRQGCLSQIDP